VPVGVQSGEPRDPFVERLRDEAAEWVREGLVSDEARQRILARYGAEYRQRVVIQRQGRLTQVISALGALLVGTGVILFVGANWDTIPTALKLALIFGSIALADAGGLWLRTLGYDRTGTALLFLGALLYGAGLALIAQIYHVQAGSGTLFLLWAAGVLPAGLALGSELLLALASLLFAAWTIFVRIGGMDFGLLTPLRETLHLPYLAALAGLTALAYAVGHARLLAINLLGASVWLAFALAHWEVDFLRGLLFYVVLGAGLLVLGVLHGEAPGGLGEPYVVFGVPFVLVPTYLLSFDAVVRDLQRATGADPLAAPFWLVLLGLAVTGGVGALFLALAGRSGPVLRGALLGLAGLVAFATLFTVAPGVPAPALAWNVALAAESVGAIVVGYFLHLRRFVNVGIGFFVLLVMSRYFDVFALYFGTYASFMVGGVLFIGLGFALERVRRTLLKQMAARAAAGAGGGGAG